MIFKYSNKNLSTFPSDNKPACKFTKKQMCLWTEVSNLFDKAFARLILQIFISFSAICFAVTVGAAHDLQLKTKLQKGDFGLVYKNQPAAVFVSAEDFKVARIAAADFAEDVERVTGVKPAVNNNFQTLTKSAVIIGTLGKSPIIENLIKSGKLDASRIQNKWESFFIKTIENPLPNVKTALVIVGSDRRGTAYGVYEMSQMIGVSPWYWWADVAPERRGNLIISKGAKTGGEPSVKYRGIFLNDEDWGLQPWAAKTFEPETGDIGPKTYAKIFELLLRLKANTLWPAMHEVTRPFNSIPENRRVADDYAIVMGSSHAEPMLRNNVGEWKDDKEKYNFVTNAVGVTKYWEERVASNGRFENIYTLGMRGIHDSPIQGTKNQAERIPVLEKIISTQRNLLAKYVNKNPEQVPQIFCPYKEVLADYRAGLKIPEDVTVVFPDDNFGYIRYFPDAEEQNRKGGFGVYYHISYLGRPLSYLWLETTPPALIWEEMSKAYEHNMRRFWVLNVGDLKPGEIGAEFFMQMAWDIGKWQRENLNGFLKEWAAREFGEKYAAQIADVMNEYYRLGFQRKPEHLQWHLPGEAPRPSDFSAIDYGDEMQKRLDAYEALKTRADRLAQQIPSSKKDAFYELVAYPVRGAALANERVFAMEKSALYAAQARASAPAWAKRAAVADAQIKAETAYFNEKLAGGKWRGIMSAEMGKGQWTSMRSTPPDVPDSVSQMKIPEAAGLGVAVEGRADTVKENDNAALPVSSVFTKDARFIDIFNTGKAPADWTAQSKQSWIKLSQTNGDLREDARLLVSIDWANAPKGNEKIGEIEIKSAGQKRNIRVPIFNPQLAGSLKGFVESAGAVSIEAEHFTKKIDRPGASWQIIPGLGRTGGGGDSVSVFPTTAESIEPLQIINQSPILEYNFYLFSSGQFDATCFLVPTQPLKAGRGLRYAIGLDDEPPQIVTVGANAEVSSKEWAQNVLNSNTIGQNRISVGAGSHVLKIYMIDAGVVLDKIVINTGGLRNSYLAPPETRVR